MFKQFVRGAGLAVAALGLVVLPQVASADTSGFSDDSGDVTIYTAPAPVQVDPETIYPYYGAFEQRLDNADLAALASAFDGAFPAIPAVTTEE